MPTYAQNKKGLFNYFILDQIEAGIKLAGAEVKSVKLDQIDLSGSYVSIRNEELWLVQCHISKYKHASSKSNEDPDRDRKLLVKKSEIISLIGKMASEGLTLIPVSVYSKGTLIKVKLGLARGKKKADKRETIKKRESDRRLRIKFGRRR
ncbi:SsrA-binding protein SmpB [Patescibacteria group bacterium]